MVGAGEAIQGLAHGWLTEDQPDARGRRRPAIGGRIVAQEQQPARAGEPEDRRRGPLPEAPEILAQPRLDRPAGPALEPLDEPAHPPERVLEGEPRVAFAELDPALRPDVAGRDAHAGGSPRTGRQAAGRQDRMEQGETKRGEDRGGPQVRLDPLEDRAEADELARRMQVEQLVGEGLRALDAGEARAKRGAHRVRPDVGRHSPQVIGIERRLALLGTAALVAADRAAVVPGDRSCPAGHAGLVVDRPDDLVDDERPAARRAARREQVADRHLEARFATR